MPTISATARSSRPRRRSRGSTIMEAVLLGAAGTAARPAPPALAAQPGRDRRRSRAMRPTCSSPSAVTRPSCRYARLGRTARLLPLLRHARRPLRARRPWGIARTPIRPSDALCAALQVLNHLQDCQKDLHDLDRCYLPRGSHERRRHSMFRTLQGQRRNARPADQFLTALLDRCDALNAEAMAPLPRLVQGSSAAPRDRGDRSTSRPPSHRSGCAKAIRWRGG